MHVCNIMPSCRSEKFSSFLAQEIKYSLQYVLNWHADSAAKIQKNDICGENFRKNLYFVDGIMTICADRKNASVIPIPFSAPRLSESRSSRGHEAA